MMDFFRDLFDTSGFPARWHCGQWTDAHGWTHVISDTAIFGAYAAIPIAIALYLRKRKDAHYTGLHWLFAAFILSCGCGHLLEAIIFWQPVYRLSAVVKIVTAVVSWMTALVLIRHLPEAIGMPAAASLNKELQREVEERRRAEDEVIRLNQILQARVTELETLLEVLPVGIGIATDANCTKIRTNSAFAQLLELKPGANPSFTAPPGETPSHFHIRYKGKVLNPDQLPLQRAASKGVTVRDFDEDFVFKDGRVRHVMAYAAPLKDGAGNLRGAVGAFVDVTELKRSNEERRKVERRLLQSQKLESLGILAGGIAHDFNNLLTGIIGHASLAKLTLPADAPELEYIQSIEVTADRAAALCKQMLAYSGKGRFVVQKIDLGWIIQDTLQLIRVSINKNTQLRLHLMPNLPPVEADATQLRQVLMNIIINASESLMAQPGSVSIQTGLVDASPVDFENAAVQPSKPVPTYVVVRISDTGCGILSDDIPR
ncbi:MAG TPA: histidine kinase dimerization/phospho-acceptor domain-containing protein, partial [Roseimicrobium sp.]|nr:histidine kinase dimerization/phospho-acceptor domain-containing protein [Roseimicrobium sp.]